MRAIVWTEYGPPDVLQLRNVPKPTPKDNQILVRIHATSVTAGDCELRGFSLPGVLWLPLRLYIGIQKPTRITILGQELAGEIEQVGKGVRLFKPGDQVFAATDFRMSAYAEYACLAETDLIALKPTNLTFEQAAVVPISGVEAWHYLNGNVQARQKVLVIGAGGSIGSFGVQIAKYFGATVTGVDRTEKLGMLRVIGADDVIDYTKQDFAQSGQTYDVIFDAPGKSSFQKSAPALKPNGQFLTANPGFAQQLKALFSSSPKPRQPAVDYGTRRKQELFALLELLEAGKIKPVIDRVYPLEQVADAHRYAESGLKKGTIAIAVIPENKN